MRQEEKLKEKVGTRLPYSVPEDYFGSLKKNIMAKLPEYPEKPKEVKLTAWQRIKPYVYLAAMFAGIWCMMQVFHHVSSTSTQNQTEAVMASIEPDTYDLYLDNTSGDDLQLEDEVTDLYTSMDDFKRDFYAQL